MTTDVVPTEADRDAQLALICEEISDRVRAGEQVNIDELAAKWPQYADELRDLVPAMRALAQLPGDDSSAVTMDQDPLREPLGDFRIERPLGRGGMGVVYEAWQLSLQRRVALKVLPLAAVMDPRQLARFKNEALAAAALNHPHIVPVYGVGEARGIHYYAMQLIRGQNLAQVIAELRVGQGLDAPPTTAQGSSSDSPADRLSREVTPAVRDQKQDTDDRAALTKPSRGSSAEFAAYFRNVARIIRDAAEALGSAHAEGVIHRDVKPSNLMLDARGKLWVTDFGLAQMRGGDNLTLTGDLVGTLRYMSPEQLAGKHSPIDHRTDIYSLGATLYELLTLRPMFSTTQHAELLRQIAEVEPTPPRRLREGIPGDLETIVLKAVNKSASDRYPTMRDLADDLERFVSDQPIKAKPIGAVERTRRLVRRHSVSLAVALGISLFMTTALGVAFWLTYVARNEAVAKGKELEKQNEQNERMLDEIKELAAERERAKAKSDEFAHQSQRLAEEKSREADKALTFAAMLVDVFKSADVLGLEGSGFRDSSEAVKQMTAVELLDRVATRTESSESITGAARAQVLSGLGDALRGLGQVDRAEKLLNEALLAQESATDVSDEDRALLQFHLGKLHHDRRAFGPAEGHYKRAIELAGLDWQSSDLPAEVQYRYAWLLGEAQRKDDAIALFEKVREDRLQKLGLDHPDTQAAELGIICVELRDAPASKILERIGKLPATQHIVLEAMKGYVFARLHRKARQNAEAKQAYEEMLATFRSTIPQRHPLLGLLLGDMARFYKDIGEMDRAMTLAEEAAEIARRTIPTHPLSIELFFALAEEYSRAGEYRKELELYEELEVYLSRLQVPLDVIHQRQRESRLKLESGEATSQ